MLPSLLIWTQLPIIILAPETVLSYKAILQELPTTFHFLENGRKKCSSRELLCRLIGFVSNYCIVFICVQGRSVCSTAHSEGCAFLPSCGPRGPALLAGVCPLLSHLTGPLFACLFVYYFGLLGLQLGSLCNKVRTLPTEPPDP